MKRHLHTAGQIADMLAARIRELAYELLPNGTREGSEWSVGSLNGEPGRSCKVNIGTGPRAGVWCDFASGEGGDALDLIAAVLFSHAEKPKAEAIGWARQWLGLADGDPAKLKRTRAAVAKRDAADTDADAETSRFRDLALRLFNGAEHRLRGTLAERYLAGRAIELDRLGRQPGALAYSAACFNRERGGNRPAMLAAITLKGAIVAVHRTYLTHDGRKDADLADPKLTLGRYRGGFIPLWRPEGAPRWSELWREDAAPAELVLAEGIENALSVAAADPSRRVAATVSLANMAAVELPPCVGRIIIARDNDRAGSPADTALRKAIAAHKKAGRAVRIARAPAGHKDFNDWLQALAAEGRAARRGAVA